MEREQGEASGLMNPICPTCGKPLHTCSIPGHDGKYIEVPALPCSNETPWHETPESRWDWFGDDKCTNTPPKS